MVLFLTAVDLVSHMIFTYLVNEIDPGRRIVLPKQKRGAGW